MSKKIGGTTEKINGCCNQDEAPADDTAKPLTWSASLSDRTWQSESGGGGRGGESERQTDTQTHRPTDREVERTARVEDNATARKKEKQTKRLEQRNSEWERQTDRQTDTQTKRQTDKQRGRGKKEKQTKGWNEGIQRGRDRQIDRLTDKKTDRQTERQRVYLQEKESWSEGEYRKERAIEEELEKVEEARQHDQKPCSHCLSLPPTPSPAPHPPQVKKTITGRKKIDRERLIEEDDDDEEYGGGRGGGYGSGYVDGDTGYGPEEVSKKSAETTDQISGTSAKDLRIKPGLKNDMVTDALKAPGSLASRASSGGPYHNNSGTAVPPGRYCRVLMVGLVIVIIIIIIIRFIVTTIIITIIT